MRKMLALAIAFALLAAIPLHAMAEVVQLAVRNGDFSMLENDRMRASFTVTNQAADKTVKAFEMRVYAVDEKGKRIWGSDTYYYWTTKQEIVPGASACSDDITLPDCSRVKQLYAAIHKVTYTDGTVEEADDSALKYCNWTITWEE